MRQSKYSIDILIIYFYILYLQCNDAALDIPQQHTQDYIIYCIYNGIYFH